MSVLAELIGASTHLHLEGVVRVIFAYNATNRVEYKGYYPTGAATSEEKFIVIQFTYDASNLITDVKVVFNKNWDDRASHF